MKKYFHILIMLLISNTAYADTKWHVLKAYSTKHYEIFSIDVTSSKKGRFYNGNEYLISWIKTLYPKAQKTADGKKYDFTISKWYFDCYNRKINASTAWYAYQMSGEVVSSYNTSARQLSSQYWNDAIPSSVGEGVLNEVCELYSM